MSTTAFWVLSKLKGMKPDQIHHKKTQNNLEQDQQVGSAVPKTLFKQYLVS